MKINEKNLAAFATSSTPVDKEGWLVKRGDLNKGYQKRWFVLKGNLLFYFEKRGEKEPVGVIVLEGCTVELAEDEEQFGFKIVFHGPGNRSYILGTDSMESMEQWMKALTCASYDYMKLMVNELQRQLDEMESNLLQSKKLGIDEISNAASPRPPPRTRHNPFNRPPITNGSNSHYNRSQSVRSAPQRSDSRSQIENTPRHKVTFRELHTAYGRPILADRNEWRHRKTIEQEKKQLPLISL